MAFKKYQKVEDADVLSQDEHKQVEDELHKLGKTSASDLSDEERKATFKAVADHN